MPTLKQLRYLVAIAETRHFRRAAEKVHISQPTLSGQLRELEHRLGVQLVERSRASVVLTPLGKEVAGRARAVLRDVEDIIELARHGQSVLGGTVRLGVPPTLGPYLLPHIVPELHRSHPALKLYVREELPRSILGNLEDGNLDVLFMPLPIKGADFRIVRLFRELLLIVAPVDHRIAAKNVADRTDLKGETVLSLERGHRLHDQVRALCQEYGANLALDYEGTSLDTLRQMVGMGMGISFMPALYVKSEVAKDSRAVVARSLRSRCPSRTVGMVWRRHSARHEEFLQLAELVRAILRRSVPEVAVMS
ncbi:MAG: LysR substrate-binding domain-containing protein [Kiloniellales bacterium]